MNIRILWNRGRLIAWALLHAGRRVALPLEKDDA